MIVLIQFLIVWCVFLVQIPNVVFAILTSIFIKDPVLKTVQVTLSPIDFKKYVYLLQKVIALAKELKAHIGSLPKPSQTKIHRDIFIFYLRISKM